MRFTPTRRSRAILLGLLLLLLPSFDAQAVPISNTATGSTEGVALNEAAAGVTLNRIGGVAIEALAEITPNEALANRFGEAFTYAIRPEIGLGDSGVGRVEISAPAGYANMVVSGLQIGGVPLASACPTPGAGQYCAATVGSTMVINLGQNMTSSLTEIRTRFSADTPSSPGIADFTSIVADGATTLATIPGNADGDPGNANSITVEVTQTQGLVLTLAKSANKAEVLPGGIVTYAVEIRNTLDQDVLQVRIEDLIPPSFKYVEGTARLNGAAASNPTGSRPLVFAIGTVPAFVDGNGNGVADPGEPGYMLLQYQLVVGSGALPGGHVNSAVAEDFCDTCVISNVAEAEVQLTIDPIFDLGLIIGKVYEDDNRNDWQDPGERGVPGAMVALDNGTYALTDEFGRYHIPAIKPGQRLLKINLLSLPPGSRVATRETKIAWVTPGLTVQVDFGVLLEKTPQSIGSPGEYGLALAGESSLPALEISGDPESMSLTINGERVLLPAGDVLFGVERLEDSIVLEGGEPTRPLAFRIDDSEAHEATDWRLTILDAGGEEFRVIEDDGAPPDLISWDGTSDDGRRIQTGDLYRYQLELHHADGSESRSPVRRVGVNRLDMLMLRFNTGAFAFDRSELTPSARRVLAQAAEVVRQLPDEPIGIEGHTDSFGSDEYNVGLSKRRAKAVRDFLVHEQSLPAERFVLRWFGESRPVATNATADGRQQNRRVELGPDRELPAIASDPGPEPRVAPSVRINGTAIPLAEDGGFASTLEPAGETPGALEIELRNAEGRSVRATIRVPTIEFTSPVGAMALGFGAQRNGCQASETTRGATCLIEGRTEPGNSVDLDGEPVDVAEDGSFTVTRDLAPGLNSLAFVARNAEGLSRPARLDLSVDDHDAAGQLVAIQPPVPNLTVYMPPEDQKLKSSRLVLRGTTDPGNVVTINGSPAEVAPLGDFTGVTELPVGPSRLTIQVTDPEGRSAVIERDVDVAKNQIFLMAFADGKVSKMHAEGYVEAAGLESEDYVVDGRVAFYLKGRIAGKYLITSGYDSGKNQMEYLFKNVEVEQTQALLTNLDPDRFYPVYGDSSSVVFDVQSRGKFYLALDSDTLHAVVGDYPLALTDTELAAYQRTLYGARVVYESASRTKYGDPDTKIVVFGAEIRQSHIHDELRATGGSLYYLSHPDVIMGSEQISLVVRDKNTGLVLSRTRQRQNADYIIKYPEGRVMFHRPISSVAAGGTLVDEGILPGQPVFIEVDYEAELSQFEKTAAGGRVRQQIGDHVAVGGTYIDDQTQSGPYELAGVDAELRLGANTRLTAEYAESSGSDATTFTSIDGGLTYNEGPSGALAEGTAWKATAELDLGEWFGNPDRYKIGAYFKKLGSGFYSNGNFPEQGTEKSGIHGSFLMGLHDELLFRHDRERREQTASGGPAVEGSTVLSSLRWNHRHERWGVEVELFKRDLEGDIGRHAGSSSLGSARFWKAVSEKLVLRLERQQTISGTENNQTTFGVQYQAMPSLSLELEGTDGTLGRSAQAGAILHVGASEIYLTKRLAEDRAGQSGATVLGARSPIGKASRVYTEYQQEDSETGPRTISLVGLQRQWDFAPGFRFVLSGEMANVNSEAGDQDRSAVSTSLSYAKPDHWSIVSRNEVRFENGDQDRTQYFSVSQFDYKLNEDFTLLARYRYSATLNQSTDTDDAKFEERMLGMAYRPVAHGRYNLITKYTHLLDQRPLSTSGIVSQRLSMDVLSLESAFRITHKLEWLAKGAMRWQEEPLLNDSELTTQTYLTIQRLNLTLRNPIDLSVEYRILGQLQADDRREGWLGEVSYRLRQNFRFGIGYNFTDFSDNEFSQHDFSVEGWYLRLQGMY